jgi:PAS domain S-box-containing protein
MKDDDRTKGQLIAELQEIRRRVTELEQAEIAWQATEAALRQSEEKLEESEEKLKQNLAELNAIINALPGMVSVVDTNFNLLLANDAVFEKFGGRETIGEQCYRTRKGLEQPCPQCGLVIAFETGETVTRVSTPEEEELMGIATKAYAVPLKDENGKIWGGVEAIIDVTDLRRAEKAIQKSEKRALETFNAINDAIFIYPLLEQDFAPFDEVNDTACKRYGYSREEFLSLTVSNITKDSNGYAAADVLQKLHDEGRFIFETTHIAKSGVEFSVEVNSTVIELDDNPMVLEVVRDITERKQAETERERLQKEIIEAQQRAIAELSTPVIPVMDRIIVMPLVGSIDSMRARDITRSLLAGVSQYRAKVVILDVTGVGLMDTGIVNHLNKTIQAARLKGAQTIVTGISDAVAEAIVDLGIDWSKLTTLSDLQTGLITALDSLGVRLTR